MRMQVGKRKSQKWEKSWHGGREELSGHEGFIDLLCKTEKQKQRNRVISWYKYHKFHGKMTTIRRRSTRFSLSARMMSIVASKDLTDVPCRSSPRVGGVFFFEEAAAIKMTFGGNSARYTPICTSASLHVKTQATKWCRGMHATLA